MEFTLSVRSFHVPATPGTCACPPRRPSVPTSRATRVTSDAKPLSWSTIVLMVSFSARISPFTSTVILRERSPRAMAVATSAMFRTWPVRLEAMKLTESISSFQIPAPPATASHLRPPTQPVPSTHLARHPRHFGGEAVELVHHRVDGFLELQDLAVHVHGDLLRQVAVGHRGGHLGDVAHLAGEVGRHRVD